MYLQPQLFPIQLLVSHPNLSVEFLSQNTILIPFIFIIIFVHFWSCHTACGLLIP